MFWVRQLLCGGFEAGEQQALEEVFFQAFRVGELHAFEVFWV
ncbi:hypothetical protein EMIT0P395_20360 [Pseudomonas sp. IT-P395]